LSGCRLGAQESYKTKLKRCEKEVKAKNRKNKKYKKGSEFAICRRGIPKFRGKKPRKVKAGQPGYMPLVRKGARKCPS
jgi:hypothetical protein